MQVLSLRYHNSMDINNLLDHFGKYEGPFALLSDEAIIEQFRQLADTNEENYNSKPLLIFQCSDVQMWLQKIQLFMLRREIIDLIFIEQLAKIQDTVREQTEAKKKKRLISNYFAVV